MMKWPIVVGGDRSMQHLQRLESFLLENFYRELFGELGERKCSEMPTASYRLRQWGKKMRKQCPPFVLICTWVMPCYCYFHFPQHFICRYTNSHSISRLYRTCSITLGFTYYHSKIKIKIYVGNIRRIVTWFL